VSPKELAQHHELVGSFSALTGEATPLVFRKGSEITQLEQANILSNDSTGLHSRRTTLDAQLQASSREGGIVRVALMHATIERAAIVAVQRRLLNETLWEVRIADKCTAERYGIRSTIVDHIVS